MGTTLYPHSANAAYTPPRKPGAVDYSNQGAANVSEMMECMKDIAEARKSNRSKVAERNVTELKRLSIPAVEQSKNVWRIDGPLGAVMYYPTSNKWQHHSRTKAGSVADLRSWLQKNGYL